MTKAVLSRKKSNHVLVAPVVMLAATFSLALAASPRFAMAQGQAGAFATNIAALPKTGDLFVGEDKTGPYNLAWTKLPTIMDAKPTVTVDDKTLTPDAYVIDMDKGTITFTTALKKTSMAHITYPYDPVNSIRNAAVSSAPVTVPMMRTGGAQLALTALPSGVANLKGDNKDALLVWKLSGAPMNALGGKITTNAMMAPDARTNAGGKDGLWDRSGLSVGYAMGNTNSGIDASFARSGREFAPTIAKSFQMTDTASQTRNLAARYSVASWMHAEWKQTDTDYLAANTGAAANQTMSMRFGGTANLPTLNLTRTENDNKDGAGVSNGTKSDKLELIAKIGPAVNLSGKAEQGEAESAGKTSAKTTGVSMQLSTQSKDKSQAASVSVNTTTQDTDAAKQANTALAITLQASPSVTITAAQTKQEVVLPATAGSQQVQANEQSSAQAKIALAPGASLSGGVTVTSAQDSAAKTDNGVQATSVVAKIGEGKGIEIQQSLISRAGNVVGTGTLETSDTRLALRPARGLLLSGALINNPEANGTVTESTRQEMGLSAKVGSLELGSGYALTELAAQNGVQTGEFSLSLGLRFNRYTQLTGQFKDGLVYGIEDPNNNATPRGIRTYTFGLTHDLGTALNFSLGGTMTQDKTPGAPPSNYKAEAKLGVKF